MEVDAALVKSVLEAARIQDGKHWPLIDLFDHNVGRVVIPVTSVDGGEISGEYTLVIELAKTEEEKAPEQVSFL